MNKHELVSAIAQSAELSKKDAEKALAAAINAISKALAEGDRNVYFVDGSKMFPEYCREDCTIDGCHPNDLGFLYYGHLLSKKMKEIIGEPEEI